MSGPCRILVRCDASRDIGSGHVMRCLTIADELAKQGCSIRFVCREFPWHLGDLIRGRGYDVSYLPFRLGDGGDGGRYSTWVGATSETDAEQTLHTFAEQGRLDLVIVDHYGLDARWHALLRPHTRRIAVLDDLHDRKLDCDLVLNQNVGDLPDCYDHLVPVTAARLVGASYAPLKSSFAEVRSEAIRRRLDLYKPKRLLITIGGVDADNVTLRALHANNLLHSKFQIDIVLSGIAKHVVEIEQRTDHYTQLHVNTSRMAELMAQADLAVGAAGVTALERCSVGLPSLLVVAADNQQTAAERLSFLGAAHCLGRSDQVTTEQISIALRQIQGDIDLYRRLVMASAEVCDGGGLKRVVGAMNNLLRRETTVQNDNAVANSETTDL